MKKVQTKNSIDVPTIVNSLKELGLASILVGGLYFLEGLEALDFAVYSPIVYASARVAIEVIKEYKRGIDA